MAPIKVGNKGTRAILSKALIIQVLLVTWLIQLLSIVTLSLILYYYLPLSENICLSWIA